MLYEHHNLFFESFSGRPVCIFIAVANAVNGFRKFKIVCKVICGELFLHLVKKYEKDYSRYRKCKFLKYFPDDSYKIDGETNASDVLAKRRQSMRKSIMMSSGNLLLPGIPGLHSQAAGEHADEEIRSYLQKRKLEISRGQQLRAFNQEKRFFGFVEPHGPVFNTFFTLTHSDFTSMV